MNVYGISTCSTYKKAIKWFKDHDIEFEPKDLRTDILSKEEIRTYHEMSKADIKTFFNTSGKVYRDLNLKNKYQNMTLEEIYQLLHENPMLIKRPLIIDGNYVRVGFKEKEYIEKWLPDKKKTI
jgi:arsenate reductase